MKLFNKHIEQEVLKDKAAGRIANAILKMQNGFANHLFAISKKWNQSQQWLFLILVCLILGGLSVLAIVVPMQLNRNEKSIMPVTIILPQSIPFQNDQYNITDTEFQKIQEYKRNHPGLKDENPPLFDSLTLVEQIYYSQKK